MKANLLRPGGIKLFGKRENSDIFIIVGLGNYGPRYAYTRHNAGFDAVANLSGKIGVRVTKRRCLSLMGEVRVEGTRVLLALPQTYMNESGRAVEAVLRFYKVKDLSRLIVIYDDIDLPLASVRVRAGGGPGTHNGMRSIIKHLGNGNFPRVRVGIGRPENGDLINFVTGKYPPEQRALIEPAIDKAADAALVIAIGGVEKAMREYNVKQ